MASAEAPSKVPDSQAAQLQDLNARAARHYSLKEYTAASDLYAQASELQASLNGETSTKNADLLYLYGRSLYQVGVSKSDVLGGKTAGEAETEKPKKSKQTRATVETESGASQPATAEQRVAEEVVAKVVQDKDGSSKSQDEGAANKPYFQITGDENWDDSDEDEDSAEDAGEDGMGGAGEGEEEEAEDDLTAAWNVLDLARVLFDRKLTELEDASGKAKANGDAPDVRHIKERLADTHDLLAEISLEGEKFPAAVTDFGAALSMKHDLYPIESSLIAEAHYKLSLALEFASTTRAAGEDGEPDSTTDAQVDEAGREEAAKEMEAAIQSCKLRVKHEEALLAAGSEAEAEDEAKITRASIDDVKEMIADMKQRVSRPARDAQCTRSLIVTTTGR